MLDSQLRYGYLQIPKSACSTIKLSFLKNSIPEFNDSLSQKSLHDDQKHWITYGSSELHQTLERKKDALIPIYTVVRNPFTRVLSGYREKIELRKDSDKYILDLGLDLRSKISFDQFLDSLIDRPQISLDSHFQSQTVIISQQLMNTIKIGYMEDLELYLEHFIKSIFGQERNAIVEKRSPHVTGSSEIATLEKYYKSQTTIDKVLYIYRDDFTAFGYPHLIEESSRVPTKKNLCDQTKKIALHSIYRHPIIKLDLFLRRTLKV
ncbi:sulfotransferase family 2 domain-containing protein [Ketobacter sp.]|uniref:sulfotransferase family 2 domain-containing protein n=1 Tax=Ketobacter sp. TaxID=2083498 RepID=UPI0025C09428|nr:sulfotransferase family 2 domain-containing protein [Ketobacter sp.]